MNIKNKTKLTQTTKPETQRYVILLCALAYISHMLFTFVKYVHAAWNLCEKTVKSDLRRSAAATPKTNARCRQTSKSGSDMAVEAAESAEKAIQMSEESTENNKRAQAIVKKARKAVHNAREAAQEAKDAADVARKNGKDAAANRAAKKDEKAKKAAKKVRKIVKKIDGGGKNDDSVNKDNDSRGKNHINDVMQKLASGTCEKMAKKLLSGLQMKFSKKHHAYGTDDMYRVLLAACMGNDKAPSIDGQCRIGREKDGRKMPSRQWAFGMINGVRRDYMLSRCRTMLYRSVLHARRRGMLRGAVDVSIDMHDIPFYAKCMRLFYSVKSKSKNGTENFNRLATLHGVTAGQRLTLGVEVVQSGDATADVVSKLLDWCSRNGIAISSLTMDRGFHSVAVINAVKKCGVPMLMPAVKNTRILEKIKLYHEGKQEAVVEHTISSGKDSASYTLAILKRSKKSMSADDKEIKALDDLYKNDEGNKDKIGKEYYVFATTMNGKWIQDNPYDLAKFYKKRWGIENSYKCHEMIRPRTTSTKYSVRILWWYLPFILYNAWILGRFMTSRRTGIPIDSRPCTLGVFLSYMLHAALDDSRHEHSGRPPD